MKNNKLKGSILIILGASCYGMLGIYVKLAYGNGYSPSEVTISQFILGFAILLLITLFKTTKKKEGDKKIPIKSKLLLMLAGSSLGLTSIFYYLAVNYIPVSVCIVLLMQMVWLGVLLEMIITRKLPEKRKLIAALVVILGSVFATRIFGQYITINIKGVIMGIMAAICYTATIYSTKNIQPEFSPHLRSLYMILGGLIIILMVYLPSVNHFNFYIFFGWGLIISLFGTVLPPLFFTSGMPLTGIGFGAILASVEIPIAILASSIILKENVSHIQWIGVIMILGAVCLMNTNFKRSE